MSWDEWIRTVEVEPSITRPTSRGSGEQVDTLLRAGARVFHFDVGDGHFVEPVTIGPVVLQLDRAAHPPRGRRDRLPPDGRRPEHHFGLLQQAGADSVTFHFEACDDPPALAAQAREHGFQVGLAFNPETSVEDVVAGAPTASTSCSA